MTPASRKLFGRITGVALALALAVGQAGTAVAAGDPPAPLPAITPGLLATDVASMPALQDLPAGTVIGEFGQGSYAVSVPDATGPAARVSVGVGRTIYIYLTRNEQTVLAGGGAAGIAAMACVSLGPAGCIGVGAAVVGAASYVAINGFCPKRLEIAVAKGYKCVS